jgi:hypothetical protein
MEDDLEMMKNNLDIMEDDQTFLGNIQKDKVR